jgi:hypothetical protein
VRSDGAGAAGAAGALLARKTWRTLEPLHGMIYFVPEAAEAYARLGITGRAGYFASRAAPMGAVTADVVVSTFFNFNPDLVYAAIPAAWEVATPVALVAARFNAVDAAFRRLLGEEILASDDMRRAAELARLAAEEAARRVEGRPLAAAHADIGWPQVPHLVLWHAQSILREYRGDGHIAQLVVRGLSGVEALVTHATAGDVPGNLLRATRGWPEDAWNGAVESLRGRGWLERGDELRFTELGAAQRQALEEGTDELAAAPYAVLGDARCAELRALARPWSTTFAQQLP